MSAPRPTPPILIVDDDAAARSMLALSLRQSGHPTLEAGSGPEALDVLRNGRCGSMVTDGKMSPMDGMELSRQAKRLDPGLRIALVSATVTEEDCHGCPIDKFFPKPLPLEELLRWLTA